MHISMSSEATLAQIISNQEASIVTIWQWLLANPPKVRFHHGHLDHLSHITRGVSKASKVTNLSEDIFVGLNPTLHQGIVTNHEYIQVGRGCGVGLDQTSLFEAKIGNGKQTFSWYIYSLGNRFDFFQMRSCYCTIVEI